MRDAVLTPDRRSVHKEGGILDPICPGLPRRRAPLQATRARVGMRSILSIENAIAANDSQAVASILDDDPLVAVRPISRNQLPVAVAAVRNVCSPRLVALLLRRGADAGATGPERVTALEALLATHEAQLKQARLRGEMLRMADFRPTAVVLLGTCDRRHEEDRLVEIAWWLLAHGAADRGRRPMLAACSQRARRLGLDRLAELLHNWGGEEAAIVSAMLAARRRGAPLEAATGSVIELLDLPDNIIQRVLDMLAPAPEWPMPR